MGGPAPVNQSSPASPPQMAQSLGPTPESGGGTWGVHPATHDMLSTPPPAPPPAPSHNPGQVVPVGSPGWYPGINHGAPPPMQNMGNTQWRPGGHPNMTPEPGTMPGPGIPDRGVGGPQPYPMQTMGSGGQQVNPQWAATHPNGGWPTGQGPPGPVQPRIIPPGMQGSDLPMPMPNQMPQTNGSVGLNPVPGLGIQSSGTF